MILNKWPNVNYFCRLASIILAGSPPYLGHSGPVAGDVEFQDDRVMDHPVDGGRGGHSLPREKTRLEVMPRDRRSSAMRVKSSSDSLGQVAQVVHSRKS